MNSFKKSVAHNNSCMYYAVHKYFRGLVATNIIMSFIKYYCSGISKDNYQIEKYWYAQNTVYSMAEIFNLGYSYYSIPPST